MICSSCSTSTIIRSELIVPPKGLLAECSYEKFEGTTQKALLLHDFYLQEQLDKCNLKQQKLLQWYKDLQEELKNENS